MRLFLREHFLLIVILVIQVFIIPILFWLDGYRGLSVSIYADFFILCILNSSFYLSIH